MSTFEVPVVTIRDIEPIENADAIELAVVGDYRSVVRKNVFNVGDKVAYLPEASVVPEWLLQHLNLWDDEKGKGLLAGGKGDRIKAVKLRGTLSQGIVLALDDALADRIGNHSHTEGDDLAEVLGIEKYEPPIPAHMSGEVCNIFGNTVKYDIENRKKYPDILQDNEEIALTEKIHGTFCVIGYVPGLGHPELFHGGDVYVGSKGLSAQGLVFKDCEDNADNVYVQALNALHDHIDSLIRMVGDNDHPYFSKPIHIMGEVFGANIQDLNYGAKDRQFRAFEVYVGEPSNGRYLDVREKAAFLNDLGIPMVDTLYIGPYSRDIVVEYANGKTVTGNGAHIREGVVITPTSERYDSQIGRVILKEVSEAYLTRKSKNATEYT